MYSALQNTIQQLCSLPIPEERKAILQPLVDFIQSKIDTKSIVSLNFICTHNSPRSHLSQIWAQCAAWYFQIPQVFCYSGGTEATALYPKILDILQQQGFVAQKLSENKNPVYGIKYNENAPSIFAFSKTFDNVLNPKNHFAAIMTCSQADEACPLVTGAEKRIAIRFEDPKLSDHTPQQHDIYIQKSLEIASEIFYVFSKITTSQSISPSKIFRS